VSGLHFREQNFSATKDGIDAVVRIPVNIVKVNSNFEFRPLEGAEMGDQLMQGSTF